MLLYWQLTNPEAKEEAVRADIRRQLKRAQQCLLDNSFLHNGERLVFGPRRIIGSSLSLSPTAANTVAQRLRRMKILQRARLAPAEIKRLRRTLLKQDQSNERLWEIEEDTGLLDEPQRGDRTPATMALRLEMAQLILESNNSADARKALLGVNRAIAILSRKSELSASSLSELSGIAQGLQQLLQAKKIKSLEVRTATSLALSLVAEVAGVEVDREELDQAWEAFQRKKRKRIATLAAAVANEWQDREDDPLEL